MAQQATGLHTILGLVAAGMGVAFVAASVAANLAAAGATAVPSPRDAAAGAGVVLVAVRDDEASRSVWTDPARGLLAGLPPTGVAVECSTVSPTWIRELARLAESADRCVVEAPMIGSRPQVEARALVHLAGGPEAALDRARDVLVVSATRVHHCGGFGTAATPNFPVELVAKDLRYLRDLAAEVAAPRP